MITRDGLTITQTNKHRHKFADALTEYIYSDMDSWSYDARGDAESTIGWYAQIGKRILRGDSQGFVWLERFGNEHEADMIVRALERFDWIWNIGEDDESGVEPFISEHDAMLADAFAYVKYSYACSDQGCDPHDYDMWIAHNRPADATQPIHLYRVTVDGLTMAHGPFRPYDAPDHPEEMVEEYRGINPDSVVAWTLREGDQ